MGKALLKGNKVDTARLLYFLNVCLSCICVRYVYVVSIYK